MIATLQACEVCQQPAVPNGRLCQACLAKRDQPEYINPGTIGDKRPARHTSTTFGTPHERKGHNGIGRKDA